MTPIPTTSNQDAVEIPTSSMNDFRKPIETRVRMLPITKTGQTPNNNQLKPVLWDAYHADSLDSVDGLRKPKVRLMAAGHSSPGNSPE